MSGGFFNYDQYKIGYIADEVEQLILFNEDKELNDWGNTRGRHYSAATLDEFRKALVHLQVAQVYAQRIDWLVSGDDGEETFHKRLQHDLLELEQASKLDK